MDKDQGRFGGRRGFCLLLGLAALASPAGAANGYKVMAREFGDGAAGEGLERVAVLPFLPADGSDPNDGLNISEKLITHLVRTGRVRTVERGMLRELMEEHHLARTGILDQTSLRRLGKILSVDAVVTGTFVARGEKITVNARLIDVESGVILAAREAAVAREWTGPGAPFRPVGASLGPAFEGLSLASLPPPREEPAAGAPLAVMDALLSEQERESLRDSPAEDECAEAARGADDLEDSVLDIKARHWASLLRQGLSLEGLKKDLGTLTANEELLSRFYDRVLDQLGAGEIPRLSEDEAERLLSVEDKAFRLRSKCGARGG